jgi:hypothetical protein
MDTEPNTIEPASGLRLAIRCRGRAKYIQLSQFSFRKLQTALFNGLAQSALDNGLQLILRGKRRPQARIHGFARVIGDTASSLPLRFTID